MESQPQNPALRNIPENHHPCIHGFNRPTFVLRCFISFTLFCSNGDLASPDFSNIDKVSGSFLLLLTQTLSENINTHHDLRIKGKVGAVKHV